MIVIIGAGVSGLTAANQLHPEGKKDFILLEKENHTGGLATRYRADGYWFDFAGHYFHFKDKPDIQALVEKVCHFKKYNRDSKTFVMNRLIPFPLQFHLSYLPAVVRKQIVTEIMENDFTPSDNLHDFLRINFGRTLFELFFEPFLTKYYNIDLRDIISNMDKGSIPPPDKERIAAGAQGKKFFNAGYNPVFYYPKPSLRHFIESYAKTIPPDRIRLNEEVIEVDILEKKVKTSANDYFYDKLITSIPLKSLMKIVKPCDQFPSHTEFHHISTLLVNAILKRKRKRFHWVYLADRNIPFYRAGFYPAHPFPACYLEKTVTPGFVIDRKKVHDEMVFTLKTLKLIEKKEEVVFFDARIIPISYILFTKNWRQVVPPTLEKLKGYGIYSIGRFGSWNYTSMSDDIKGALHCVRELNV
jgi:protoporphyrinogen oxidase